MNKRRHDLAFAELEHLTVSIANELAKYRSTIISEEEILNAQFKLERLLTVKQHFHKGEYLLAIQVATEEEKEPTPK